MEKLLLGKPAKKYILDSLNKKFASLNKKSIKIITLDFTQTNENHQYNKSIKRTAESLGILCENLIFNIDDFDEAFKILEKFNKDPLINGILINQPLKNKLVFLPNYISKNKDLEAVSFENLFAFFLKEKKISPCTPKAVLALMDFYKIPLEGKDVCVLGRSLIVGKSLFFLLLERNATVTLCHSYTKDVKKKTLAADIVISSIGKPLFLKKEMFHRNSIIIDVGINFINNSLCGDVDFNDVVENVQSITPVPGGVGVLTSLMLFENLFILLKNA